MALRHDDELPPLTPRQQADALRLAARLQAEASSTEEFLRAAEEAGIEPRFLHEAIRRLPDAPQARTASGHRPNRALVVLLALAFPLALALSIPPTSLVVLGALLLLVSLLFALPPCSMGRSRRKATALVFGAWLAADIVFMAYCLYEGAWGNFEWTNFARGLATALALQGLASLAGAELARQAYRLPARRERRRPQSL